MAYIEKALFVYIAKFIPTLQGVVGSILEVVAMTCLVFLVLTHLPPTAAIFAMNGIFMVQAAVELYTIKCCDSSGEGVSRVFNAVLENKISRIAALLLQVVPILAASVYIGVITKGALLSISIALPLCLLTISAVWSTQWQRRGTDVTIINCTEMTDRIQKNQDQDSEETRSRYKSSKSTIKKIKVCITGNSCPLCDDKVQRRQIGFRRTKTKIQKKKDQDTSQVSQQLKNRLKWAARGINICPLCYPLVIGSYQISNPLCMFKLSYVASTIHPWSTS